MVIKNTAGSHWRIMKKYISTLVLCSIFAAQTLHAAGHGESLRMQALTLADNIESQVIAWRRHIHQNPELSYQETNTAAYVAQALAGMPGIEVHTGIAKTGIKAVLRGGQPGPVVALRADMDGLPVQELNDLPYKSVAKGVWQGKESFVSHACGHDAHVAMLLGAAKVLSQIRETLPGTVVFLFQPAEELGPDKIPSGAKAMVAEGVLQNPRVDVVMGQHIDTEFPSGKIGYRRGGLSASGDKVDILLRGKGGHGSSPWLSNEPTLAAAEIVLAMQNIISHKIDPLDGPAVLTVGMLQSGNRPNVLPDTAEISGTVRSLSVKNQKVVHEQIRLKAQKIAESYGVEPTVSIQTGYEVLVSDPVATTKVIPALKEAAGSAGAVEVMPMLGSEDFGSFAQNIPVVFWRLAASPFHDRNGAPNHSTGFVIDEKAMRIGVRALVNSTLVYMDPGS